MNYLYYIVTLSLIVFFSGESMSQSFDLKSSYGDKVSLFTSRGGLYIKNKSVNTLSVSVVSNHRVVQRIMLYPDHVFTDSNNFFKRSYESSKGRISISKLRSEFKGAKLVIEYDDKAFKNDSKIITKEIERNIVLRNFVPIRNLCFRYLGAGELLFYKSLLEIGLSNESRQEKEKKIGIAILKKGAIGLGDSKTEKLIIGSILDFALSPKKDNSSQFAFEFLSYCSKRLAEDKSSQYDLEKFKFKFFPHKTLSLSLSHPVSARLLGFKNIDYRGNGNYPESLGPFYFDNHIAFGLTLNKTVLSSYKGESGRMSLHYEGLFERGAIFYKTDPTRVFPENTGFYHDKFGVNLGAGGRVFESKNNLGLEIDFSLGGLRILEKRVELNGNTPMDGNNSSFIDDSLWGVNLNARFKIDLRLIILSVNYNRQIGSEDFKNFDRYFSQSINTSIGIPISRRFKVR